MNKILTYIDNFINLLDISSERLTTIDKIEGDVVSIDYSNNKITKIQNLNETLLELILNDNKIRKIENLNNNLEILRLSNNKIRKIENLNEHLKTLSLSHNKISKIQNLNNNLEELYLTCNNIKSIKNLTKDLKILNLSFNYINKINNLSDNIRYLNLSHNLINKIENLSNNITHLHLNYNFINKIENLTHNITHLNLAHNRILQIEFNTLPPKLISLDVSHNFIKELPIFLLELKHLQKFKYNNNPIIKISLPVQRWLNTINKLENNKIYMDKENVHNHNIQQSFRKSVENILNNNYPLLELNEIKNQINENNILTPKAKYLINEYCNDTTQHGIYLITFGDLLRYVWARIINSEHKDNILEILNDEMINSKNSCFMGRIVRLINTLVGFYDDIEIQISDSEQIANIILSIKNNLNNNNINNISQIKNSIREELLQRHYSEDTINEWLEYI